MGSRLADRFTFQVERLLVRGAQYRLLLIAMALALISVLGGALVLAAGTGFDRLDAATWWAFLRLSDPGYLGDDVGTVNRVVSTILTVLGYVVFLGALVAVMTQALNERMERLEAGLTPVARDRHVVILGWTNRTEAIVRELLASRARVRRFLRRFGARELHIVVLARSVTAALAQDLRDALGEVWDERRITLRSGTALRPEHLDRVDAGNAAAVIIPASEQAAGADRADTHTIKALLSLARGGRPGGRLPYVVAEILATDKARLAERIYPGDLEVVPSHAVVSRLLAQNIRHAGLSEVYNQLLTHRKGVDLFIRDVGDLAGRPLERVYNAFPRAILLGVVRPTAGDLVPHLNPAPGFAAEPGDRLVLLAHDFGATEARGGEAPPAQRGTPRGAAAAATVAARRVLVLGWNHEVPALLEEFSSYRGETFELEIASAVPVDERHHDLRHSALLDRVTVRHSVADFTDLHEVEALDPARYDVVLFLGSDWLGSSEESDARTVMGVLLLQQVLHDAHERPEVIVELLDPDNVRLLGDGAAEVIISPLIVSHMLAQVALRRELQAVFEELFTAGGAEIAFRAAHGYADAGATVSFSDIEAAAHRRGELALGVRRRNDRSGIRLAPERGSRWTVTPDLEVVALVRES